MASLPKSVKMGALTIGLKEVEMDNSYYGHYIDSDLLMEIRKDLARDQKKSVVIHECFHACFAVSGLRTKFTAEQEEEFVRTIEPFWFALMKDNPKLMRYLLD